MSPDNPCLGLSDAVEQIKAAAVISLPQYREEELHVSFGREIYDKATSKKSKETKSWPAFYAVLFLRPTASPARHSLSVPTDRGRTPSPSGMSEGASRRGTFAPLYKSAYKRTRIEAAEDLLKLLEAKVDSLTFTQFSLSFPGADTEKWQGRCEFPLATPAGNSKLSPSRVSVSSPSRPPSYRASDDESRPPTAEGGVVPSVGHSEVYA